jgi:microcin C transport system substrate-binding protein
VLTFAGGTTVFSKAWFEETGARIDESTLVPFLGTGPYVVQSFDVGRQIVYGRSPDFWGADHPLNVGQNNFDRIRIEYFADSSAALEAFKAGVYTFRNENSARDWSTGYDFPKVRNGHVKQAELPDGTIGSGQGFVFNLRKPEWQDPRVREAARMMFNFEWSNETLFFGLYERVNSFWENSELEATGVPSEGEIALLRPLVEEGLLPESILTDEAVMAPVNAASENLPSRAVRREAGQLLEEAGWIAGPDGMRTKDGRRLTMTILQTSASFDRIVNPYVDNLRQIGIDARLERVDIAQYVDRRRSSDYDLVNHTFSMGFEPGIGLRQWYASETADDSSRNLMGLRDPAVDRLVTAVIDAKSLEEMTTAVHALDRVLRSIGFWVPQWFKDRHTVAYYDMYRYPDPLPPFALGEVSFWWYDAEAADRLRAAGAL